MKFLIVSALACAALVSVSQEVPSGISEKEARDQAAQAAAEKRHAEKKSREARARAESEAYQQAKQDMADQKAAQRAGKTLEEWRLARDQKDAENAGVTYDEWMKMDRKTRDKTMRDANEKRRNERDTAAAEKAGLSLEDYRLQREAKNAGCTLEEWKALDKAGRRAKRKEREAAQRLEWETKQAEKSGLSIEDWRAKQEADRKAKNEAEEAERKALREKIHQEFSTRQF